MSEWLWPVVFAVARWGHMVGTALLVGGIMFYEVVVPIAIEDLKASEQYSVFARARWAFRWVVWISLVLMLATGAVNLAQMWGGYHSSHPRGFPASWPWAACHVVLSCTSLLIAFLLTVRSRPPAHPIRWMRINLVILLVTIFVADVARQVRLSLREEYIHGSTNLEMDRPIRTDFPAEEEPETQPATTAPAATQPDVAP